MGCRLVSIDPCSPDPNDVLQTVRLLDAGGIVAYPTDTLYGLGVSAINCDAVDRLFALKQRRSDKPVPLIVESARAVGRYATHINDAAGKLMEAFWPGPLSLVLAASDVIPVQTHGGTGTVALRVPAAPFAQAVARELGAPLTATSANMAGSAPSVTAREVQELFQDRIDLIIDGGPAANEQPSTIVDVTGERAILLRKGAVRCTALEDVLGYRPQSGRAAT